MVCNDCVPRYILCVSVNLGEAARDIAFLVCTGFVLDCISQWHRGSQYKGSAFPSVPLDLYLGFADFKHNADR